MSLAATFASQEALCVALASGLVPPPLGAQPVRALGLEVFFDAPLQVRRTLERAGVAVRQAQAPRQARQLSCWAELLALSPAPEPARGPVVFMAAADGLVDLAAELLRLGCERQELRLLDGVSLLRAHDPPYYVLLRALDRAERLLAFVPVAGRERVWIQAGHQHPLADRLQAPEDASLFVGREGWRSIGDGPWLDLSAVLELAVPPARTLVSLPEPPRRRVPLRLVQAARREAPSLWVLRQDGVAQVDRLLAQLPDEVVARLQVAVTGRAGPPGDELVVLRARPGRQGPPALELAAEAYAPLLGLPDLFAPDCATVEPPLGRERLRQLLASPDHLTWLTAAMGVERVADSAFMPLGDWVDYVVERDVVLLEPWVRGVLFEFAGFVAGPAEVGERRQVIAERAAVLPREPPEALSAPGPALPMVQRVRPAALAAAPGAQLAPVPPGQVAAELAALEAELVSSALPAEHPERAGLWLAAAGCYVALGQPREAGLAYSRAIWSLPSEAAQVAASQWAGHSVLHLAGSPTTDQVRAVAAHAVAGAGAAHELLRWLDRHDAGLDVRSRWLAHLALARRTDDKLGLARARDRVLAALGQGLDVARDLPALFRFVGKGGIEAAAGARLAAQLEALLAHFESCRRSRSEVEAPVPSTRAYVLQAAAAAFARLGRAERAAQLRDQGASLIDLADPVHGYAAAEFAARIEQALAGRAGEPLPPTLAAQLAGLGEMERYKVDRLRQTSLVLGGEAELEPALAFARRQLRGDGDPLAAVRSIDDPEVLLGALEQQLTGAEPPVVTLGLGLLLGCREEGALALADRLLPRIRGWSPGQRWAALVQLVDLAGHFARGSQARALGQELVTLASELDDGDLRGVARQLSGMVHDLVRVDLKTVAADILRALDDRSRRGKAPALLALRLTMAGGFAALDDLTHAEPAFAAAEAALAGRLQLAQRLDLVRAMAVALGHVPVEQALPRLASLSGQLGHATDSFATNSHFCLSVVHCMESLLAGVISTELALGHRGRRWLEQDELLVRRRLHRDLGELA